MSPYPEPVETALVAVFDAAIVLERANRDPDIHPLDILHPAGRLIGALYKALDASIAGAGWPPRDSDEETKAIQGRLGYVRS